MAKSEALTAKSCPVAEDCRPYVLSLDSSLPSCVNNSRLAHNHTGLEFTAVLPLRRQDLIPGQCWTTEHCEVLTS